MAWPLLDSVNPIRSCHVNFDFRRIATVSLRHAEVGDDLMAKPAQSVEQKFLEYAKMTPAERMHAQMLAQLGLTEDQFKAMSPADQQKIEDKIREMIKQQATNNNDKRTGLITDKSV